MRTPPLPLRIAVDTGGTFTDLVALTPSGHAVRLKVPSTPEDPGQAVISAIEALYARLPAAARPPACPVEIRHGTTVATNALLERDLARAIWITTAGFEDTLYLRRQARPDLYALHPEVPPPLVDRDHTLGIEGRLGPNGERWQPLEDVEAWIERHAAALAQAEAIGICLLHAYAHPEHERRLGAAIQARWPAIPVTLSHTLAPVPREYERGCTVAINAALAPIMSRYVRALAARLAPAPLTLMGSDGGLMSAETAATGPAHTVLSGPAGGVRGAWRAARRAGVERVLALDMGGTSADVSVMVGGLTPEDEGEIEGYPVRVPLLPIETVGAGGGSIAYIDEGGALRVGPRSAGAQPGPACYGRGGLAPTVTDAHAALGRIEHLLGGEMPLDVAAARRAVATVADPLGLSVEETAAAILAIAEATMARACKAVSLARGHDPRTLTLVAFGGAGGLHACAVAEALGCPEVLCPRDPGVLSAEGIAHAPATAAATASVFTALDGWGAAEFEAAVASLWRRASADLAALVPGGQAERHQLIADCRYRGQTYTLPIPVAEGAGPEQIRIAFDHHHTERYGHSHGGERPVEVVTLRLHLQGPEPAEAPSEAPSEAPRQVHGPLTLSSYSDTLWLPEGWIATATADGGWRCRRAQGDQQSEAPRAMSLALEIHRQRIAAIAEEMGAALMRSAFSANIKERRDFSCAIFDGAGQMIAHAAHIPVHLGATPLSVAAAIEAVEMSPGDQVMLNDPYAGGTHLPDVTVVAPVYLSGDQAPTFYVANRAHHADVGGISAGSLPAPRRPDGTIQPLTLEDEGICVPPTRIDDALRARFAGASRTPEERIGDLRAQEAANRIGARLLRELVADQGLDTVNALNDGLLDYTERRIRAVIDRCPEGRWTFEDALDDDSAEALDVPIPVTLTIGGGEITVDFTDSPPMVSGPLNSVRAIAVSAAFYVFRCVAGARGDLPANSGLMRPIRVLTRPGTLIHAAPPAAVSAGNVETSQRVVDALLGALAQALPGQIPAASGGSMNNVLFGGERPGGRFVHYETLAVGAGASPQGPGAHGVHTHMTNTLNTPIEAIERDFPVQMMRYALRWPQPTIAGGHPGGVGIIRAWRFLTPVDITLMTERRRLSPWSLGSDGPAEGDPALRGRNALIRADGIRRSLPGKISLHAEAGDTLEVETPCGGHWRP